MSLAAVNLPALPDRKVSLVIATKPQGGRVVVPTGSALVVRAPAAHAACFFAWTRALTMSRILAHFLARTHFDICRSNKGALASDDISH